MSKKAKIIVTGKRGNQSWSLKAGVNGTGKTLFRVVNVNDSAISNDNAMRAMSSYAESNGVEIVSDWQE